MSNDPEDGYMWVRASNGKAPAGSLIGGHDNHGEPIYVARAPLSTALIPGKLVASHNCAYISWDGAEFKERKYEVLVGGANLSWRQAYSSKVPEGAVPGGHDLNGEILYIGRVRYQGSITTGKVQASHGSCYIPFNHKELRFHSYEVLVRY